jgi:hypothetical protein
MTNMRKFGGKGLVKLDDVCSTSFRDEIDAVTESQYGRPVLHFKCGRQFSLNVTNTEIMLKAYGDDDRGWLGQDVELYSGMLPWNGGEQEGVCLKPISLPEHIGNGGRGKLPTAPPAPEPGPDEFARPGSTRKPTQQTKQKSAVSSPDLNDDIPY